MAGFRRWRSRGRFLYKYAGGRFRNSRYGRAYARTGLNLSMPFMAGAAVGGLTSLDNNIDVRIKILLATAPVKGFGAVKAFAQGVLFGDAIQSYTGFRGFGGGNSGSGGANEL